MSIRAKIFVRFFFLIFTPEDLINMYFFSLPFLYMYSKPVSIFFTFHNDHTKSSKRHVTF